MGTIPDDMAGIFAHLREAALTMQQGGGIGYDFSTLRPKGAPVKGVGADASGPLSFMDVWDAMCRTIMSAGYRRGAMMATLRCDHPDIEAFIEAKREPGRLRMFNLSVLVTDAFMDAVKEDAPWELTFAGTTYKVLPARELWDQIMRATYDYAEPGVIFIDRINRAQQSRTIARRSAPPIPAASSRCRLMAPACWARSIWRRWCASRSRRGARSTWTSWHALVPLAVRMLDNVDRRVALSAAGSRRTRRKAKRRIGLGVTGLADALIFCGARYGSAEAVQLTETLAAGDRARGLSRLGRARRRERRLPAVRHATKYLAGETSRRSTPRRARRDRAARHPQRAAHLDRADRHDLAVRRQRLVGHRAGVQLPLHPQGADAGRQPARGGGRAITPIASSAASRATTRRCPTISSTPRRWRRPIIW